MRLDQLRWKPMEPIHGVVWGSAILRKNFWDIRGVVYHFYYNCEPMRTPGHYDIRSWRRVNGCREWNDVDELTAQCIIHEIMMPLHKRIWRALTRVLGRTK